MQIRCHRPTLAAAFNAVAAVVPARTPKEILRNVHLIADAGTLTLAGTDAEIGLRYELTDIDLGTPGETLLPAARVGSMLRELTDDAVEIAVEDSGVRIACGHSEFKLSPNDPAEFPEVPKFEEAHYLAITGGVLKEAIGRTVIATDTESTRYALGGVLLEPSAEKITFAATDSRRLAVVEAPSRFENEPKVDAEGPVVPSKAMNLIARAIDDVDAEVTLAIHANDVLVKAGPVTISSRLVQGRFPKYRAVIPNETPINIDLVTGPLHSAVRQAMIVTSDDSRGVDFTFGEGTLTLNSAAADVGTSKIDLPIPYEGEPLTITFDPRFVAEFLRTLEPETALTLGLTDGDSQAVLRVGESYTYVIMPLSRDR